jgi:hypothetical protein
MYLFLIYLGNDSNLIITKVLNGKFILSYEEVLNKNYKSIKESRPKYKNKICS